MWAHYFSNRFVVRKEKLGDNKEHNKITEMNLKALRSRKMHQNTVDVRYEKWK